MLFCPLQLADGAYHVRGGSSATPISDVTGQDPISYVVSDLKSTRLLGQNPPGYVKIWKNRDFIDVVLLVIRTVRLLYWSRDLKSRFGAIYSHFLRDSHNSTAAFPSLGRPQMESDVYIDTAFHGEGSRLSTLAAQAPAIRVCTTCIVHARARDQAWPKGGEEGRPQQPIRRERGIRL